MLISSHSEVESLRRTIYSNADTAYFQIKKFLEEENAIQIFSRIKFDKIGRDPVSGTQMNLIEQINQTYSSLVVLAGVDDLLTRYSGKRFRLQLGSAAGCDIESEDGEVAAECFAVTTVDSNRKLKKDSDKLMKMWGVKYRHIYFYSRNDSEEKLHRQYAQYPSIIFERVQDFQ